MAGSHPVSRITTLLAGVAGMALFIGLLSRQDWLQLLPLLTTAGITGVTSLGLYHLLPLWLDTLAWRVLLPTQGRPRIGRLLLMRWHGESVNTLLPMIQIGGDLLRARLAWRAGVAGPAAAASVLAELALSVLTLVVFVAAGWLWLGLRATPLIPQPGPTVLVLSVAGAAVAAAMVLLIRLPTVGATLGARMARGYVGRWHEFGIAATALTAALDDISRDRRGTRRSALLQMAAWCAGAGEIGLGLALLGHPVTMIEALLAESLLQGARNAAFIVPGAIGIQEGALVLIAPLIGIGPEPALALALLRRGRELLLGVPGLAHVAWHMSRRRGG